METKNRSIKQRFYAASFTRIVAAGYFILLLLGTFLLMLPVSAVSGEWTSFPDALTTATSASCVTGLIVFDTFTHWSLFGQVVLLGLIQMGGLGYMTLITVFSVLIGRKISLRERGLLKESTNSLYLGGIVNLTKKTVAGTLIFEGIGAVILTLRFYGVFGLKRAVCYGIFHSVSAFCNAGFDLMGVLAPYSSMEKFNSDPIVLLTLSALIVTGGIGFVVWQDITENRFRFRKYRLHSKIAISTSLILLFSGSILIFALEYNNTLAGMNLVDKIFNSLFTSASARTAGFGSIALADMTPGSYLLHIVYMLIGGSPGSTAGGLKTTTFAVLLITAWAGIRNSENVNVFRRRLGNDIIRKALTVVMIYFSLVFVSAIVISATNPELTLAEILFEVSSAIGTVGISCGVMEKADMSCQMILTLLMYCGRVGSMSFAMIFTQSKTPSKVLLPEEKIIIG